MFFLHFPNGCLVDIKIAPLGFRWRLVGPQAVASGLADILDGIPGSRPGR